MTQKFNPRGERMPETREQFEYMASRYEEVMLAMKAENAKLRAEINNLKQKLASLNGNQC